MSHTATAAPSATTNEPIGTAETMFTAEEARALESLRRRYREDHDLFSPQELAQLRFLRWLVCAERLVT